MAASATDKFKKVARKWVGQIGAGGVADAAVTTIPLASSTNLPTDTGVEVVIGRVDSSGTKTSTLEETVVGVVSGSNLVSCTRGIEGTAQAHGAGAVVEVVLTADNWNDLVDGVVVEHAQDGTHGVVTATSVDIGGSIAVTGTLDEDAMGSDSAVKVSTQQSIKAYVDSGTTTLTNKRVTKRVVTTANDATAVIDIDAVDVYELSAMSAATEFTVTGTETDGQTLVIRLKDDGTTRALTWTDFTAVGVTLPVTTTVSKWHYIGCMYNLGATAWHAVAVVEEA